MDNQHDISPYNGNEGKNKMIKPKDKKLWWLNNPLTGNIRYTWKTAKGIIIIIMYVDTAGLNWLNWLKYDRQIIIIIVNSYLLPMSLTKYEATRDMARTATTKA